MKGAGNTVDAEARRKLLTFWNCYSFFVMYAAADGWKPGRRAQLAAPTSSTVGFCRAFRTLWAALMRHSRTSSTTASIEAFQEFDEEFSNWYLRRSRRRFWQSEQRRATRRSTPCSCTVTRLMAPVLPFLTEEIYQNLVRSVEPAAPESVHLTAYPQVDKSHIDEALERNTAIVIRIKNLAHNSAHPEQGQDPPAAQHALRSPQGRCRPRGPCCCRVCVASPRRDQPQEARPHRRRNHARQAALQARRQEARTSRRQAPQSHRRSARCRRPAPDPRWPAVQSPDRQRHHRRRA